MRWQGGRRSANIEDRRGMPARGTALVGGGIGTIVILLVVMFLGGNPIALLQQLEQAQPPGGGAPVQIPPGQEEAVEFVSVVLADTEDVWREQFPKQFGEPYRDPTLQLFTGEAKSACGFASSAVGPFYCPADEKVYIDLAFYDELARRFNAPGDFAQAYVIAHEVGHHIQNLLGTSDKVHQARSRLSEADYNDLSVRLELQADFYAGVWAHHAQRSRKLLEQGDLEEALQAASAIGDDNLQMESQGYVVPDSFTHGTSEQRARWFRKGFETGDVRQGDTFKARQL